MSLNTLSAAELDTAGEFFGVEFKKGSNKAQKIQELELDGVTYEQYVKFLVPDEEEVVETPEGDLATVEAAPVAVVETVVTEPEQVLLVMERKNPTYEVYGHRFTREHPFQLVDESVANQIMKTEKGFRPAMPAEAREFYG